MARLGPRLVVAGTHSGVGKTTVATGLMAAFAARGHKVAAAKVGPDYIDPAFHAIATGKPSRNLDEFLSGEAMLPGLAAKAAEGADLLLIEGVMGLFDGSSEPDCDGSTAAVARSLAAPIVLVVDAGAMSDSVAALVHGYSSFDPTINIAGVVLNKVGGQGHTTLLRQALEPLGVPVLGALQYDPSLAWRDRHLGLVPVAEQPDVVRSSVLRLGEAIADSLDLELLAKLAGSAPARQAVEVPRASRVGGCAIAVCGGPAFSFNYQENLELLEQAGGELLFFDPLVAEALPSGACGLYAGGGFPEVFAPRLSANGRLLDEVRQAVRGGLPTWAECGGYMWLAKSIDTHPMAGVIEAEVAMSDRLTIGYRRATTLLPSPLGPAGLLLRGHEFHRSRAEPAGDGLLISSRFGEGRAGELGPNLFASYLHQHLAATPQLAERFVSAATSYALRGQAS
jgi:cobyrinic acid a,c-diamide synthase